MRLNDLHPGIGGRRKKVRVGRGIGSTLGKTCGRGHKGQKARAGGYHKVGFEGGQMPLQRRLPKFGFTSRKQLLTQNLPVSVLNAFEDGEVSMSELHALDIIKGNTKTVKLFASGDLNRKITLKGIPVTKGAKALIEKAGGSVG